MGEVYYVNETKTEKVKRVAKEKYTQAKDWVTGHGKEIVDYSVAAVGLGTAVIGLIKSAKPSATEQHYKRVDKTYYDPSTGIHWELRRRATNKDRKEIVRRKRNGENVEDILEELGLIK